MRNFMLLSILLAMGTCSIAQTQKENGTIYIAHPYIDVVNNSTKAYLNKDTAANKKIFSDTAVAWASGMEKPVPIAIAIRSWLSDFDYYTDIKVVPVGYPDYLHYVDKDQKFVQSWWLWSGTSKKTGAVLKIDYVQFDKFNNDGKIVMEGIYGDFSKMEKNK